VFYQTLTKASAITER